MEPWKLGLTLHNNYYSYKELLEYSGERIVSSDTHPWEKEIFRFIITWLSNSDHIIQYSSGTTGRPKEIKLSKMAMIKSALNTCSFFNLHKGDSALLCMPTDYIAGKMMIVRSMAGGLNLFITEPRSVPEIRVSEKIDFCAMVPLQVTNLMLCSTDLSPVKKLLIGGAEISRELEKRLQETDTLAFASYGMAETCSHVAIRKLNGSGQHPDYIALPDISLSADERSCLLIHASYLPAPVISNDMVSFTGNNRFRWIGRFDNLINSGGIKIVPEEVEALVMEKESIECVAMGIPDKKLGNKLVIVVEDTSTTTDSADTLKTRFAGILPRRWKPKEVISVPHFPRNDALKIDRRKLAEIILNCY
ncbi:MAG TPA: AMP-binding protein [Bacteroidales bacterium]|nr:AMP-binding protein [Bacteroidales bacterium]